MSADAERAVIGAIFLDPNCLRFATEHVGSDDFSNRYLGAAFDVITTFAATGDPIDEQTVAAELRTRGIPADAVKLFELREQTPTASNVGYYARIVADHAGKRRASNFGVRTRQLAESTAPLSEVMEDLRREWQALNARGADSSDLHVPTLAEILDGPTDYDWIIPNLMEREDRLVLTGSEGAGKSYFVQQMAILSAAGIHPTTFAKIDPIQVLVVDAENSDKQWRRRVGPLAAKATREGVADPRLSMRIKTLPRMNILDEKDLGRIHRWIDEYSPDLLVIGPFYKLTPKAINSDDDAAPVIAALDGLRARGCALVMEAHAGKSSGADGERNLAPRGASALMGWPEFGFGLRLDRNTEGPSRLAELVRWRGDRDERAWPKQLARGGDWPWSDADPSLTRWQYDQATRPRYA